VRLSVVIPARNEADSVGATVEAVTAVLGAAQIDYEVIVVDDASGDGTGGLVRAVAAVNPRVRYERSPLPPGFGHAVRHGLGVFTGDAVAIVMADGSDTPEELIAYLRVLEAGYDCAFGTRFGGPGKRRVHGYPLTKLVANRIVNWSIRALFRHGYSDTTNAFKAYRREVIENISPLLSNHFNLTVELPLKAIVRGYSYSILPISWHNREHGASKLRLQEMGSRYLFIVLYVFLEHHLSRGDYRRPGANVERLRPQPMSAPTPESDGERSTGG
jgi:dolichol-phosphate mannosyltransferase